MPEESEIVELKAKIIALEERNVRLMEDLQNAENEKRYSESELFRLQKDLARVRTELERLKSPPLVIGSLRDVLPDNKVVVKSSTGPDFVVTVSEYCPPEDLIVGSRVALNKQTLSLMNVLPSSVDPVVSGAEILENEGVAAKAWLDEDGDQESDCEFIYGEVYEEGGRTEVHMLFDNNGLKYLTFRCTEISYE